MRALCARCRTRARAPRCGRRSGWRSTRGGTRPSRWTRTASTNLTRSPLPGAIAAVGAQAPDRVIVGRGTSPGMPPVGAVEHTGYGAVLVGGRPHRARQPVRLPLLAGADGGDARQPRDGFEFEVEMIAVCLRNELDILGADLDHLRGRATTCAPFAPAPLRPGDAGGPAADARGPLTTGARPETQGCPTAHPGRDTEATGRDPTPQPKRSDNAAFTADADAGMRTSRPPAPGTWKEPP